MRMMNQKMGVRKKEEWETHEVNVTQGPLSSTPLISIY